MVIGHSSVATLDMPMVGASLRALYCLLRWFEAPSAARVAQIGVASGIAAATKLSAITFIGVVALAWGAASLIAPNRSIRWPARMLAAHIALAALTALVALWACYGFNAQRIVTSFEALLEHNRGGHLSYFMGELRRDGWWHFYLVALALKTPLPLLMLALAGGAWSALRAWRERSWLVLAPTLAFAAILLFASAYSHINIGVRHVLLLYPLMAIMAAELVVGIWRRAQPAARAAIVALFAWQSIGLAAAHPDELAYFNELAGGHPERYLIDSDLDWGQDLRRLKRVLAERHITHIKLVYRGTADFRREGFPDFEFVWPHRPTTGWIAVSLLAKATGSEDGGYDWLDAYRPVMRVGKSIGLYYIE